MDTEKLALLNSWIAQNTNKPLDFDHYAGNQCVDTFRFYLHDVLGVPQPPGVTGAYQLALNYDPKFFDWIPNTLFNVPQKGDAIIWKATASNRNFGHVGIFLSGNVVNFQSFDQNFPSQGYVDANGTFVGTGVAHIQNHSYINVLGFLRFKGSQPASGGSMSIYKGLDLTNQDSMKVAVDVFDDVVNKKLYVKQADVDLQIKALTDNLNGQKQAAIEQAQEEFTQTMRRTLRDALEVGDDQTLEQLIDRVKGLSNQSFPPSNPNGSNIESLLKDEGFYIDSVIIKPNK